MIHRHRILTTLVLALATAAVASGLLNSGVLITHATQDPKMSLDMNPSGNGVSAGSFGGNVMTVGTVEQCQRVDPFGFPAFAQTDLIIEDVEDLVGWQSRFNYDGTKVSLSSFNETPFSSVINTAPIGFTNLPFDLVGGVHRGTTAASGTINAGTSSESTLIGASYLGTQTFPVSPDTPYVGDEGTQTYDAPNGGVLARIIWQLLALSDGDPSVHLDLDDGSPNAPGSRVFFFTGTGTTNIDLAESDLTDGFLGVNTDCVVPADIDIKPGGDPNSINAASQGLIPVAILSTASFDATTVDGATVQFGAAGASPAHDQADPVVVADHQRVVNGDSLPRPSTSNF